jgi:hypothetical protein
VEPLRTLTNLALEGLKLAGINLEFAEAYLDDLETALGLIADPVQRTHEAAQALAELRAGQVPTIVVRLIEARGGAS